MEPPLLPGIEVCWPGVQRDARRDHFGSPCRRPGVPGQGGDMSGLFEEIITHQTEVRMHFRSFFPDAPRQLPETELLHVSFHNELVSG